MQVPLSVSSGRPGNSLALKQSGPLILHCRQAALTCNAEEVPTTHWTHLLMWILRNPKVGALVKSHKSTFPVIPAKAGYAVKLQRYSFFFNGLWMPDKVRHDI